MKTKTLSLSFVMVTLIFYSEMSLAQNQPTESAKSTAEAVLAGSGMSCYSGKNGSGKIIKPPTNSAKTCCATKNGKSWSCPSYQNGKDINCSTNKSYICK